MMNCDFHEVKDRLKNCIISADKHAWQQLIMIEDDVARQSINKWFEDYFMIHEVKKCEIVLDDTYDMSHSECKCRVKAQYQGYEDYSADLLIKVKADNENKVFKIVGIEHYHLLTERNDLCWHVAPQKDEAWWKNSLLGEEISKTVDLPHRQLARVITRNVRFREAHIQLECASIMTCMMSGVISNICRQLNLPHENSEQKLKSIYNLLRDKFRLQITRPDRDNTWASKYLAPWFGLEEIMTGKDDGKRIAVSCNFFMSTLYSLLRWCGFEVSQLVQFRIVNQDYLIVLSDEQKLFFISHDNLTLCSKRTIYPSGKINRVFGAEWFIDFKRNFAEISLELIKTYNYIAENTFLPLYSLIGGESDMIPVVPVLDTDDFRGNVFRVGNRINSSIYPWVKYANQTLYVSKPETYVYWSVQSDWGNILFKSEEDVYDYMNQMGNKSIFPESDRIMTSDQCIRHQTGGEKDLAVFLFAAFKKFLNGQGCVVFTKKYEYVVYRFNKYHEWVIYNVCLKKKTKLIEGEIILAFNHMNSYYPNLIKNRDNEAWFKEIIGEITKQEIL